MNANRQSANMKRKFPDQDEIIEISDSEEDDSWTGAYQKMMKKKKIETGKIEKKEEKEEEDQDVIFQSEQKIKFIDEFKTIANISFLHVEDYSIFKCLICGLETEDDKFFESHLRSHLNDGCIRSETNFCTTCNLQFNAENLLGELSHLRKYHSVPRMQQLEQRIIFQGASIVGCHKAANIVQRIETLSSVQSQELLSKDSCSKNLLSQTSQIESSCSLTNGTFVISDQENFSIIPETPLESAVENATNKSSENRLQENSPENLRKENSTENFIVSTIVEKSSNLSTFEEEFLKFSKIEKEFTKFTTTEEGSSKFSTIEEESSNFSKSSEKDKSETDSIDYELEKMFSTVDVDKVTIISNEKNSTGTEEDENSANFVNMPELSSGKNSKPNSPSNASDGESLKIRLKSTNGFKTAEIVKSTTCTDESESPRTTKEKIKNKKLSKRSPKKRRKKPETKLSSNYDSMSKKQLEGFLSKLGKELENLNSSSDEMKANSKSLSDVSEDDSDRFENISLKDRQKPNKPKKLKKVSEPSSSKENSLKNLKESEEKSTSTPKTKTTQKKMAEQAPATEPASLPKLPLTTQKVRQSWEEGQMTPLKQPTAKSIKNAFCQIQDDLISKEKSCLANDSTSKKAVTLQETKKSFVLTMDLMPWMSSRAAALRNNTKSADVYEKMLTKKSLVDFFKCMGKDCCFTTSDLRLFLSHTGSHLKHSSNNNGVDHCPYCELVVTEDSSITLEEKIVHHITDFHQNDVYQCSKCFYRSREDKNCYEHFMKNHPKAQKLIFKCPEITKTAENEQKFIEATFQRIKYKKSLIKPIPCPICPEKIFIIKEFYEHLIRHSYDKDEETVTKAIKGIEEQFEQNFYGRFQCLFCQLAVSEEAAMSLHMAKHSSELRFCCLRDREPFRESNYQNPHIQDQLISNENSVKSSQSMLIHKIELQSGIDISSTILDCSHFYDLTVKSHMTLSNEKNI